MCIDLNSGMNTDTTKETKYLPKDIMAVVSVQSKEDWNAWRDSERRHTRQFTISVHDPTREAF